MKKILVIVSLSIIFIAIASVVATAEETALSSEVKQAIEDKIQQVSSVSGNIQSYVEEFVSKRNIGPEKINDITKVDFDSLPKEVNIENVNDANLAIHDVNYNETNSATGEEEQKNVYVVTYSVEELKKQGDLIIAHDKREFLNFGYAGTSNASMYLETATGVQTSKERGYVMMRDGSITGLSTSLEVLSSENGEDVEVIILKNGELVRLENVLSSSSAGVKVDYDIQSPDVLIFNAGDTISVYVQSEGVEWKDSVVLLEITTK